MMQIGQKILRRYKVEDLIHECGQAMIGKGTDTKTGQHVAIRQLAAEPGDKNKFLSERARFQRAAAIQLGHPNVLDPIDSGEDDGDHFMILPFIDGDTLTAYVSKSGGRLDSAAACDIIKQIAAGLQACHDRGITHRDLKPDNVMIDSNGHVSIIDFGLASVADQPTITQGNGFQGSLGWAAPEQVMDPRARDPRLDLYALGCIFYFLLTGTAPHATGTHKQIALDTCQVTPPSPRQLNPSVSSTADQVCMTLLAKSPEARFNNAAAVIQALAGGGQSISSVVCPSCQAESPPDATFCTNCGSCLSQDMMKTVACCCFACGHPINGSPGCANCQRPFGAVDHRMEFRSGALTGRVFRIPQGIYVTGREALDPRACHISRRQLLVACVNGSVTIEDAGSANPTEVDGRVLVQAITLQPNSELFIAGNVGVFITH